MALLLSTSGFSSAEENTVDHLVFSIPPGTYSEDTVLEVSSTGKKDIYYSFTGGYGDSESVIYRGPVILSALPGEHRTYKMKFFLKDDLGKVVFTRNTEFAIDKTVPQIPEISVPEGVYNGDVELNFKKTSGDIYFSVAEYSGGEFSKWNGLPVVLKQGDYQKSITVAAFSMNKSGRKSALMQKHFIILPDKTVPRGIKVLSPVPGTFLNSQLLYLDTSGFKWIRYSIGNDDPAKFGTTYRVPVLFRAEGSYILNIAGLPENSTRILKKRVEFSIAYSGHEAADRKSGMYSEPLAVNIIEGIKEFSIADGGRGVFRPFDGKPFLLRPVEGLKSYITLKLKPSAEGVSGLYRYFYVFDRTVPGAPIISGNVNREDESIKIEFFSDRNADIYYTDNGSTPDKYSLKYRGPFKIKIKNTRSAGSVIIKAVSIFKNGLSSSVSSKLITYDLQPPDKPVVAVKKNTSGEMVISVENGGENRIFYTVNYNGISPDTPDMTSFAGSERMVLKFPEGMSGKMMMKIILADSSGNLSEPYTLILDYDTMPPPVPEAEFTGGMMNLTGEGTIYYLFAEDDGKPHGEPVFTKYTSPVDKTIYTGHKKVLVFAEDASGNKSPIASFKIPDPDINMPAIRFSGVVDGGLYNTGKTIRFFFDPDADYYYRLGKDNKADMSAEEMNKLPDTLYFDCGEGQEKEFSIDIMGVSSFDKSIRSEYSVSFTIDRKKPVLPVYNPPVDNSLFNRDISIAFSGAEKDSDIWIVCTSASINKDELSKEYFFKNGELIENSYNIRTGKETDTVLHLAVMAVDKAGNCSISSKIAAFRIDKKSPPDVLIKGLPPGNLTNKPVEVTLESEEGSEIFYKVEEINVKKDVEPFKYTGPFMISGRRNNEVSYRITAWAYDEAGNRSLNDSTKAVMIGLKKLSAVPPSIVQVSDSEAVLSFEMLPGMSVYYKTGSKDGYLKYEAPVKLSLRRSPSLNIFYYTVDAFRNSSPVQSRTITVKNRKTGLLTGVEDSGIYNSGVRILKRYRKSVIRYEAGVAGDYVPSVSSLSPEMPDRIEFDAIRDQVLKIVLKVREYDKETHKPLSQEEIYRFTIDKESPPEPFVTGVSRGDFYQKGRSIEIEGKEGTLYFNLIKDGHSVTGGYKKYTGPVAVDVKNGTFSNFAVKSYAEDAAGNKSSVVSVDFSIDKAIVYLSTEGKDSYDGTRSRPLRSLAEALKRSYDTGRKYIYVTEGEFLLDNEVDLKGDISIFGGFGLKGWEKSQNKTFFSAASGYKRNTSLFRARSGNTAFSDVTMTNLGIDSPVIVQNGGKLIIEGCEFIFANGRAKKLMDISGGKFFMNNTRLVAGPLDDSVLLSADNSSVSMDKVSIEGSYPVKKLRFFDFSSVKAEISDLYISSMESNISEIFNIENSSLNIDQSSIFIPKGKISSSCFILKDSSLVLRNSKINAGHRSRIVSVVDAYGSDFILQNTSISVSAEGGVSVFNIKDTGLNIQSGNITVGDTGDFIYLMRAGSSNLRISDSDFKVGKSSDTVIFGSEKSSMSFRNNRVDVLDPTGQTSVLDLGGMAYTVIENNIFKTESDSSATAITLSGSSRITVKGNIFQGWSSLLNFNGLVLKTGEDLNTFSGFSSSPSGNISR